MERSTAAAGNKRKFKISYFRSHFVFFGTAYVYRNSNAMLSAENCLIIGGMFFVGHMLFVWLTRAAKKKELKKLQAMSLNRFFEVPL